MNRNKLAAFVAATALTALAAGCGGGNDNTANTNANRANTNTTANANANTAGNTNTNTAVVTNTNNVSYNANITREEYEKNKQGYSDEAKKSGHTIGSGANDGWLWVKVRSSLLGADDLRDSTIGVDVDNGVVTLSGTVANGQQKIKAVDVAKKVEGVKSVTNKLAVKADGDANRNGNTTNSNTNHRG